MNKIFWYSKSEMSLVDIESADVISAVQEANDCLDGVAQALRVESLDVIPVLPIWVYGTLLSGEGKHDLIKRVALPEFKPLSEVKPYILGYSNEHVPFPAAVISSNDTDKLYMERYLIKPSDLPLLDQYEGAPDLYSLEELPDNSGYFYKYNLGLNGWKTITSHDWRLDK